MATTMATTTITMTDQSLIQLMTLLSPVFPVGGFAYSGGLETACSPGGGLQNKDDLKQWIETSLTSGYLHNDGILLTAAHTGISGGGDHSAEGDLDDINDLALALSGSSQRHAETINLGSAFLKAAQPWLQDTQVAMPDPCAYAVAVGAVTARMQLALEPVLNAFLQAAVSNQLQAALRLMSLGQQAAVTLQHELEPTIQIAANRAAASSLADLGSCAINMDLAVLNHETLNSRIFRS